MIANDYNRYPVVAENCHNDSKYWPIVDSAGSLNSRITRMNPSSTRTLKRLTLNWVFGCFSSGFWSCSCSSWTWFKTDLAQFLKRTNLPALSLWIRLSYSSLAWRTTNTKKLIANVKQIIGPSEASLPYSPTVNLRNITLKQRTGGVRWLDEPI